MKQKFKYLFVFKTKMIETLTEAEKKLKAFAEQEPKIIALYKGKDFEEGTELYYFLAPGQMDPIISDI